METTTITEGGAAAAVRKSKKVMVAIDDSEASSYALKWALVFLFDNKPAGVGAAAEEDMVVLVHVQQPFQHYVYPPGPGGTGKGREADFGRCDPKDKICQATEQMQVDLLVVGSRGLGKIKRKTHQFILFVYFDFNNAFEMLKKVYIYIYIYIMYNYKLFSKLCTHIYFLWLFKYIL
ncbi:hypothetical protein UlMin_005317 [Ulmus minor]